MAGSSRETRVVLTATVAGYTTPMLQAGQATAKTAEEASKLEKALGKQHAAMTTLGTGFVAFGAVAAAGVTIAVQKYAEFDKQMSAVQAATHATADSMGLLRDAAIDAGATTAYSATEAAQGIEELSKAGLSTAEILGGGLTGALSLAAAGGIEVGDAAQKTAIALKQFGLEGDKAGHVADLLAAGAGKAVGDVSDMSAALAQSGLVANQFGLSVEDTTGVLAAFADQGLLGSDAGTSLKTMLQSLVPNSAAAREEMEKLGISAFDAQGQFIGITEFAGQYQSALSKLSPEQQATSAKIIFGSDAVRAANVLYTQGADGIQGYIDRTNDAGYAAESAALKQDNLAGDLEKLGGAFDTLLIKTGAGADGPLRAVVQSVTDLVDAFSDAPPIVQQTALGLGVVAAAVGLVGGGALLAIPKIAEMGVALQTLSTSSMPGVAAAATGMSSAVAKSGKALSATASFLTGPWGVALAAAAVGVQILNQYLESLKASTEDYQNVIKTTPSAKSLFEVADEGRLISFLDSATGSAEQFQASLNKISTNDFATGLDLPAQQLKKSLQDIGSELAKTAGSDLPAAQEAFRALSSDMGLSQAQSLQLLNSMPELRDALIDQASAAGIAKNDTNLLELAQGSAADQAASSAEAYIEQAESVDQVSQALTDLLEQFNKLNGINQDAVSANAEYQESLAGIAEDVQKQKDAFIGLQKEGYEAAHGSLDGYVESLDGFSLSLDENTASGATNAASLASVAASAQGAAAAQFEVDKTTMGLQGATDKYNATLATQRSKFEQSATAAGYNADQVKALGDRVFNLPSSKQIQIQAQTAAAQAELDRWITLNNGRVVNIRTVNNVSTLRTPGGLEGSTQANGSVLDFYGDGGMRENHTAQIAPAGAWRVWAEPETGGEAYIPLAPSKRERSLAIWEETGKRLNAYVDGGMWQPERYVSGGNFAGQQVTVNPAPIYMDMPVYTDGSLLGFVRGVAGQTVKFALATEAQRQDQGWRPM